MYPALSGSEKGIFLHVGCGLWVEAVYFIGLPLTASSVTFLCPAVPNRGEDRSAPPADRGGIRAQNGGRETTDEVCHRNPASACSCLHPGSVWLDLQVGSAVGLLLKCLPHFVVAGETCQRLEEH